MNIESIVAAFGIGLLGAGHCMGMCGGILASLKFANGNENLSYSRLSFGYNFGRVSSYVFIGIVAASFPNFSTQTGIPISRTLAGILIVLMGFYIAGWWHGLVYLEKVGKFFWQFLKPLGQRVMPITTFRSAVIAGLIWGWLPCGLVYSALALALTQSQPIHGAWVMLAFGIGTLPIMLGASFSFDALRHWLKKKSTKLSVAALYCIFGVWTLLAAWGFVPHFHLESIGIFPCDSEHSMH